jgi:nucleotide-binding universal stress UspA family protein
MKPLRNILIGTSLSQESDQIVRIALELTHAAGASAHLVHAFTPPSSFGGFPAEYRIDDGEWIDAEKTVLWEGIETQIRRAAPAGLGRVHGYLEEGAPHRVLARMAEELRPELIVVGAVEQRDRLLRPLGSTADRVVRQARCPVLVVRPGSPFPPSRVLAPVDLSDQSGAVLRCGLDLLEQAGALDATTEALFVLSPAEASIHFSPDQIAYLARQELKRFGEAQAPGVALERKVRTGLPWEQILSEAKETKADLLLVGTQGRTAVERLLLGSVTADVLREARCSLLVVPPGVAQGDAAEMDTRRPANADWTWVSDSIH